MIFTFDIETFFSTEYSIGKSSPLEYIRDEKFKAHGAGCKIDDQPAEWVSGADLASYLRDLPWGEIDLVAHNANFDATILAEKYGVRPRRYIDTLGLCRALLYPGMDFSLGAICPVLGLGDKGDELVLSKGMRDLTPEVEGAIAGYAIQDAELTYKLFQTLWPSLPDCERDTMHIVVRMSTDGVLEFDRDLAQEAKTEILEDRSTKLEAAGTTIEAVRSRDIFARLLRDRGVEPPTKISPANGEITYAFSKQDPDFVRLRADKRVADIVAAREACTSNNAITRIDRLVDITSKAPHTLPVQLNFSGAHTGRLSGGGKINLQNLNARGPQAKLRHAIMAPPGHVIVVRDLSGIELRMNMWFSGQDDALELIRRGEDLYKHEAVRQFGVPIDKVTKTQRDFAKAVQLGCGFYMGHQRFRDYAAAGPLGMNPIYLDDSEAFKTIQTYRANHPHIAGSWRWLGEVALPMMLDPKTDYPHGPAIIKHEAIELPNGMELKYPNLTASEQGWYWSIDGTPRWVHGGILQENIVQALAGVVMKHQMNRIDAEVELGRLVHQVHDEVLVVCREEHAEEVDQQVKEIMETPIDWCPDLPLATEGGWDVRYTK